MVDTETSAARLAGVNLGVGAFAESLHDPFTAVQGLLQVALKDDQDNPVLQAALRASIKANYLITAARKAALDGTIKVQPDPNARHLNYLAIPAPETIPKPPITVPRIIEKRAS